MRCPKTGADCVNCTIGFCAIESVQPAPTPRTEDFWVIDKPASTEEAMNLLRFGCVLKAGFTYETQEQFIDQARTERRMLACADFFERELSAARQQTEDWKTQADGLDQLAEDNENRAIRAEEALFAARAETERLREALTELVELKRIKRRMEANSAHPRERLRYEQGKENAWSRAEAALTATHKEEGNG